MKISSITIAKNESANIAKCLQSLQDIADEIIVLIDKSTTDSTETIVQGFPNCTYEVVEWQGYAKTKEYAVSLAKNEWIFWIDADEELSAELRHELAELKKRDNTTFSAYSLPRKAKFLGRWIEHSGWYPGYITRIFHRDKARFTAPEVHEGLIIEGPVRKLNADLYHYTDPNIFHYFYKFNNYTSLAASDLFNKKKPFSLLDVMMRPPFAFFKMYVLKAGFLDGIQGLLLALFSSFYVLVKYAKLWEKYQTDNAKDSPL